MKRIFVSAGYPGNSIDSLSDKYDVHVFDKGRLPTAEELAHQAEGSSALITTVSDIIDKNVMDL